MTEPTSKTPAAGRELDAEIAVRVMGLAKVHLAYDLGEPVNGELYFDRDCDWGTVPYFSTDMTAAFRIVEKLGRERNWTLDLKV